MPIETTSPHETQSENTNSPPTTAIDRDCAFFVRDALFPLRRDWGSSSRSHHHHSQIHPALMALDRLRTDLIDFRPTSTSYSNLFPRGVLLVKKSEALVGSSKNYNNKNNNINNRSKKTTNAMEYNGQPDVDESTASLEVIPNLLTVTCMRCNGNPFLPSSASAAKAFVREKAKPSWKITPDDDDEPNHHQEHELVVCSDRILQSDYYRKTGGRQRREDLPVRSMNAVEEVLARELTKLTVNRDDDDHRYDPNSIGRTPPLPPNNTKPPLSVRSFPSSGALPSDATASCEAYAHLELMAARAAECLLVHHGSNDCDDPETRTGSALRPSSSTLFSMLPPSLQSNFVDRCTLQVATQHTLEAAANTMAPHPNHGSAPPPNPRECVQTAWATHQSNTSFQQ